MSSYRQELAESSVKTLANAIQLSTNVILRVSGNEIANTIAGEPLAPAALSELIATRLKALMVVRHGGQVNAG